MFPFVIGKVSDPNKEHRIDKFPPIIFPVAIPFLLYLLDLQHH